MSKNNIWDISKREQTKIKLDILQKYLKAWATIIGSYFSEAYFIDCFAGRGKYHLGISKDKVFGSPLIGLNTSVEIRKIKQKIDKKFDLNIIAIESNKSNLKSLKGFVKEINTNSETKIEILESEFNLAIPKIIEKISNKPSFFFIDPYGIKGMNRDILDLIVNRQGSAEIFLNYMKMGVKRVQGQYKNINNEDEIIRIKAIKTISHMDNLFGDKSWIDKTEDELLKHFVKEVFSKKYKFVLSFDVPYPDRSGTIYNLLFATNYNCGEKIMRNIMTAKLFKGTLFENYPIEIDLSIK